MSGGDMAWLETLEEKVHAAADRIRELGDENERLAARVAELEGQDESAEWEQERSEIRSRVESLAEGLEALLADR
ncbi:MAG: cell division protein ZapB [Acidobacteriota bacterium]